MRWSVLRLSHANLMKTAAAVTMAGVAAGCSNDVGRFDAPLFAGATSNQRQIIGTNGIPPTATPEVQRAALAPVGPSYAPPASGRGGWTAAGAPTVTVEPGETADAISRRYGVPVDVIVAANRLNGPYDIRPGTRILIPSYTYDDAAVTQTGVGAAPVYGNGPAAYGSDAAVGYGGGAAVASAQVAIPAGDYGQTLNRQADSLGGPGGNVGRTVAGGTHTVAAGDTAFNISQRYGIRVQDLILANNLPADGSVRLGQVLSVPGSAAGATVVASAAPAPSAVSTPAAPPAGVAEALAKPREQQVA